jgi:hypothetical protein
LAKKPLGMLINFNETVTIKVFPGVSMLKTSQELSYPENLSSPMAEPQESKLLPRTF